MPTNEEGEFELVLGNKQLLSVFFIVVLLLGVFFTMGYIVGRNTTGGAQAASVKVADQAGAAQPGAEPGDRPSPAGTPAEPPKQAEPPKETALPGKEAAKAEPKPDPPKSEPAKAEPPKAAKSEPPKQEPPKAGAGNQYLQVAATRKSEGDLLAEVLSKKGYPTIVVPVPDSGLVRVLVGPLKDQEAIDKMREELTAAGFKPFTRKL